MDAVIYSRWSSFEQNGTTSAPRQAELNEQLAQRNGWPVTERLIDAGKSAWTGDNIITGELGRLIDRLERTRSGAGKVLIVEKLDRLSRQPALVMAAWMQRACATGLTIATSDGRHVINGAKLVSDQMAILAMIFEAFRANDESSTKSARVAEAWARKRDRGQAMTRRAPAWLRIDAADTAYKSPTNLHARYSVIEPRAAVVRRIFDMTEAGLGKATIAATLNREGVAPFGRGQGWHASYVQKITRNVAVIGEFQPHTKPKGGERKTAGDVIRDYFPAIITVAQFERVNDHRATRVLAQQSGSRLVNLLAGIGRCHACGGTMTMVNNGAETLATGETVDRRYLRCSNAHRSHGCTDRHRFPYPVIEEALLDRILHLAMDDQHFADQAAMGVVEGELIEARRALTLAESRQRVAYAAMEDDPDDQLAARRYRQRRDDAKALRDRVAELSVRVEAAGGAASPTEHIARVAEVRAMMSSADDAERYAARSRVKLALNDLIARVEFSGRDRKMAVVFRQGVRYIVLNDDGSVEHDGGIWRDCAAADDAPAIKRYFERKKRAGAGMI